MAMLRGDFPASERLATEADELGRPSIGAAAAMAHGAQLVFLRWLQGRPGQVEALLDRLAAQQAWAAGAWPALLPLAYAGQGRDADARRLLDRAMAACRPPAQRRRPGRPGRRLRPARRRAPPPAGCRRCSAPGPATTWPPARSTWARPTTTWGSWPPRPVAGRTASGTCGPPWPPTSASGPGPGRRSPPRPSPAPSAAGTSPATRTWPRPWTRPPTPRPSASAWSCQDGAARPSAPAPDRRGRYPTTGRSAEAASEAAGPAAEAARRWGSTATMMRAWRS